MDAQKPRVRPETEYTYTNKFNNKRLTFTPKPDEVVASIPVERDETDDQRLRQHLRRS
jgi:hypothetical protein